MSGIAVELRLDQSPANGATISSLLAALPHRGPDGSLVVENGSCAMGIARRRTTSSPISDLNPVEDVCLGILGVGDVRLDNRDELAAQLVGSAQNTVSSIELLALGYDRWGEELANHLEGDFAFALWDSRRRVLYAARDPFGTRPLFYHRNQARLLLCSEVDALLQQPGVDWALEDRVVLDHLLSKHRHYRETFFRDVRRILPGHYLRVNTSTAAEVCYWKPPDRLASLSDQQCVEGFRDLFKNSVGARLSSSSPIVAQLSGGLDSSSIVCMAAEICRDNPSLPDVVLASATYPGLECDETPWIDAVVQSVPFRSVKWDARAATWPREVGALLAHPWWGPQAGGSSGAFEIARAAGARVVLSGYGGDELLFERGIFQDLAAKHQWHTLLHQTLLAPSFYSSRSRLFFFREAIRPMILPAALRRAYRRLLPRRSPPPPQWLTARLQDFWREESPPSPYQGNYSSRTQQSTWNWLTSADAIWNMEMRELDAARRGMEVRFPFLDRRLASFVLSLPFERRLPTGQMKQILRRAMSGVLPPTVVGRSRVTTFGDTFSDRHSQNLPQLRQTMDRYPWRCEPYVQRQQARQLLSSLRIPGRADDWREWMRIGNIAILELWLDALASARQLRFESRVGQN